MICSCTGYTAYSTPAPSGGPLLLFILNVMDRYHLSASSSLNLTYHRLIEAFKYGFAMRTLLGDPDCDFCVDNKKDILDDQCNMTRLVMVVTTPYQHTKVNSLLFSCTFM